MPKDYTTLANGTGVRFKHLESSGWEYVSEMKDGKIIGPNGDLRTPSGAAAELDKIIRGDDGHDSWGPKWWEYFSGEGWDTLQAPE